MRRIGETLKSTHDLRQMLQSILNTASDAVQADAAILWTFTSTRTDLYASLVKGVATSNLGRVRVGDGIVGLIAERGVKVILPSPVGGPSPAAGEPSHPNVIGVPLYSRDRMKGVLTTYRRAQSTPFTQVDRETVVFLAEQGNVAIENVELHEEAQRLSLTDGLTGVWNRRYFQMQFRQVLATSQRFQRPFSLLMLDLDLFKAVNDSYGHPRGDAILVEFARRVSKVLREVDTFARYGGEEFACLLSETHLAGGAATAEKVRDAIRGEPFGNLDEEMILLTVSIGVASYPEHGDNFRSIVEAADRALYRAKQEGRDRVVLAGDEPPPGLRIAT
ncbi:MAG: diguanylate cyclase [Actinomycetota bacterium]